jgi:hypothetical protein
VFTDDGRGDCRGDLTVSLNAGREGEPDPVISEEGRRFMIEQLHRLTPDHVRAFFSAAPVDQLGDTHLSTDPRVASMRVCAHLWPGCHAGARPVASADRFSGPFLSPSNCPLSVCGLPERREC